MERNTITTLGSLRKGDRFYRFGDKNKVTQEMMDPWYNLTEVLTNEPVGGAYKWNDHQLKKKTVQVVFLRHTIESDISSESLPTTKR